MSDATAHILVIKPVLILNKIYADDQHEERILGNPDSTHQLADHRVRSVAGGGSALTINRRLKNVLFEACPGTMQEVKETRGYENVRYGADDVDGHRQTLTVF